MTKPTEQKAKMMAGELYLANDQQLEAEDLGAQQLLIPLQHESPGRR